MRSARLKTHSCLSIDHRSGPVLHSRENTIGNPSMLNNNKKGWKTRKIYLNGEVLFPENVDTLKLMYGPKGSFYELKEIVQHDRISLNERYIKENHISVLNEKEKIVKEPRIKYSLNDKLKLRNFCDIINGLFLFVIHKRYLQWYYKSVGKEKLIKILQHKLKESN